MSRLRWQVGFWLAAFAAGLMVLGGLHATPMAAAAQPQVNAQAVARVMQVQDRHTARLMAIPGVVGTATGLNPAGQPVVKVFLAKAGIRGIPAALEGVPVQAEVTGVFVALKPPQGKGPGNGGGGNVDPTARFDRPVPIGVSTGNAGECSAGTISCRVKDETGNVYALSNNHVYALENNAPIDSDVLQPGLYDTNCIYDSNNVIGTLSAFMSIKFDGPENTIDAAIASSSLANLGNATPSDGYGTPKSATVTAAVGQKVQKYGRTTSLTKGQVSAINANVNVGYSSGTAHFVSQIVVSGRRFIKAGDSGSLLVTDPDRNPVGLLFAGNINGSTAIANPIDAVLNQFGVTIDGE
jgi:hypothetical protein